MLVPKRLRRGNEIGVVTPTDHELIYSDLFVDLSKIGKGIMLPSEALPSKRTLKSIARLSMTKQDCVKNGKSFGSHFWLLRTHLQA
jgi:hypothetical protein